MKLLLHLLTSLHGPERRLLRESERAPPSAQTAQWRRGFPDRWRWGIDAGASLGHRRSGYLPARMALGTRWERVSAGGQRLDPRHGKAPAAWRSSPPTAAPRRASNRLVADRCRNYNRYKAICQIVPNGGMRTG